MKEDLNENTYTNDAYKLYLSDPKHEYSLQNTKVHTPQLSIPFPYYEYNTF